jgi:hypothetical protein
MNIQISIISFLFFVHGGMHKIAMARIVLPTRSPKLMLQHTRILIVPY